MEVKLNSLEEIGVFGLLTAMLLEGSSLPFPGIAVVLAYGYLLPFSYLNTVWIAAGMSAVYCLASLVPYFLGSKLDNFLQKRSRKGLNKAKKLFNRYGGWSVAVSRPFGIGNYISYVAGMSKMRILPYLILTFIGIYPWSYVMILLGNYFNGSYQALQSYFQENSVYFYIFIAFIASVILLYFSLWNKSDHSGKMESKGGKVSV